MKKFRIAIPIIALLLILAIASPAYALDEPDSVSAQDIEVFQDLLVTDDALFIIPYSIPYTTEPDVAIDKTYIFRILSANGTDVASVLANPAYNGGYGDGMVAAYVESGIVWGDNYTVRIQQNPTYYPSSLIWDFSISSSSWSTESDQAAALKTKIIDIATDLNPSFGVELLTQSEAGITVLSTYGELYFLESIPGLQTMCPALFQVQLENPDYTKRSWSYTLAETLQTKYAGTFIYDFMTGYAGLFSMETSSAMNFLSILGFVTIVGLAVWKFKASMLSATLDGYVLLLLLMLTGFFSMIWAGFMAFCSTVIGGVILFLNRS